METSEAERLPATGIPADPSPGGIVHNAPSSIISMSDNLSAAGNTTDLDIIRRRLGDIATCKAILEKTKSTLLTASDSLHLDTGDLSEFCRAQAFIDALLPTVDKASGHVLDACKTAAILLHNLKDIAAAMHAGPLSELKRPEPQYIIPNTTQLPQYLTYVQDAMKEAMATIEKPDVDEQRLKSKGNRILRAIMFGTVVLLGYLNFMHQPLFLPFLGMSMIYLGTAISYGQLYKKRKQELMSGVREQAIRKETVVALKRVQLISTHVGSLHIPERINSELMKSQPFGLTHASKGCMKVGDDLQETINVLEDHQQ